MYLQIPWDPRRTFWKNSRYFTGSCVKVCCRISVSF